MCNLLHTRGGLREQSESSPTNLPLLGHSAEPYRPSSAELEALGAKIVEMEAWFDYLDRVEAALEKL